MKKNVSNKKPHNKWKITAIISLVLNGLIALLLVIGFASPKVEKASAYLGYDNSKIITTTQKIDSDTDYYLYFDWKSHEVDGEGLYYFPLSNNVPSFNERITIDDSFRDNVMVNNVYIYVMDFIKYDLNGDIYLIAYWWDLNTASGGALTYGTIRYQIEPESMYIEFNLNNYEDENADFYELLYKFTSGIVSIPSQNTTFVIPFFSQYSVQVLSLKQKFDNYQNLFDTIYFESEYSFNYHEEVDIRFLQSTLFLSVGQPFFDSSNTNYNDYGYQIALRGLFKVGDNTYTGLAWVWKEFDLTTYYAVTYNDFTISRGITQNHYYYLDSLCPYDSNNEEIILDKPLFIFHEDSYINQNDYSGGLRINLSCRSVNQNYINSINLYPNQLIWWSNLTTLFEVKNYFSFYNGEVSIETPIDTDITSYSGGNIGNVFVLISGAFESLIPILSIVILPGITLGMLVFIPIIAIVIIVVIKLVKR